jgi:hypothetical protein
MAHPDSFYHYIYDWQGMQHDTLVFTLLKSCRHIMNSRSIDDVRGFINQVILQMRMDGYYRLEVSSNIHIEHFQAGHQVSYQGARPQKGSENRTIKVVELEHAIIYKMHFIQLYLSKHQENPELLEESKEIWLLWLMHVESVCLQASLQHLGNQELSCEQQIQAKAMNIHADLDMNASGLLHQVTEMYQTFNERLMPLLTPAEYIDPCKHKQLLVGAITLHQEQLSVLIKQQYGLYSSTKRLLESIRQD